MANVGGGGREKRTFNAFNEFNPLHFDMLNATPYSLSKEGNILLGRFNRLKGVTLE